MPYDSDISDTDQHPFPNITRKMSHEDLMNLMKDTSTEQPPEDSITKKNKNLPTTVTDMYFEAFANKDKLIDPENIKTFNKADYASSEYPSKKNDSDSYRNDKYVPRDDSPRKDSDKSERKKDSDRYSHKKYTESSEDEDDEKLKKLDIMRQLAELVERGVKLSRNYTIESNYKDMKYEHDLHKSILDKKSGIRWLNNMTTHLCYAIEWGNEKWNPFDFYLNDWSKQVESDIDDGHYVDVFGELYEKYVKAGKPIPPELKLLFLLSASAIRFHLTHSMLQVANLEQMLGNNNMMDKLRQQARMGQNTNNSVSKLDEQMNKEHELAQQRIADLEMLKRERDNIKNNQRYQDELQSQLNQQQNEILLRERMLQDEIQKNRREMERLKEQLQTQQSDTRSNVGSVRKMNPPRIPASLRKNVKDNESTGSNKSGNFNPKLDEIINNKIQKDMESLMSNDTKKSKRSRRPGIKINI